VNHACQAKMATSVLALAIASYISLHPTFLLPPIGLLCYDRLCAQQTPPAESGSAPTAKKVALDQRALPKAIPFAFQLTLMFSAAILFLFSLSRLLLTSWQFIPSVYLTPLQLPDLTPNPGL
ncbi:hypothetical protein LTR37_015308, partial [Vermiconidia calcicola]